MVKTSGTSLLSTDFQENIVGATTYASSCMEYFKQGDRTNGSYTIRPDVELHSFEVTCEFTEKSGFTIIKPENWPKNGFTFKRISELAILDQFWQILRRSAQNQGFDHLWF